MQAYLLWSNTFTSKWMQSDSQLQLQLSASNSDTTLWMWWTFDIYFIQFMFWLEILMEREIRWIFQFSIFSEKTFNFHHFNIFSGLKNFWRLTSHTISDIFNPQYYLYKFRNVWNCNIQVKYDYLLYVIYLHQLNTCIRSSVSSYHRVI